MQKASGILAAMVLACSGIAPALGASLDGEWSGQIHCSPIRSDPVKFPAFSNPISMVVTGRNVSFTRDTSIVHEALTGKLAANGYASLAGEGRFKSGNRQPWTTKIEGQFSGSYFNGRGDVFISDGTRVRDCTVELAQVVIAQPRVAQRSDPKPTVVSATPAIPKPAGPSTVEKHVDTVPPTVAAVPMRVQAAFPPGAKLMRGSILCDGRIGEAAAVDPEREGHHISLMGESDFGPFEGREGSIQNSVFKGQVMVGGHDCGAVFAREFVPNAVPTGIKSAPVEGSVLQKLRSENWTLITNASRSRACDEKIIKQANALMAMGAHLQDNVSNWPKVGSWAATYMKRAPEIVFESGCMSQAASQNYEGETRRRGQVFRSVAAGTWMCRATLGSREFWEGRRKWVFEEKYVESYMSLPNGNTLLIMVGLPNDKILHLEPRVEQRDGKRLGTPFIDMLDAEIIEVNPSSLRFRITKADAGYFPAAGGMVTCTR